jgi:flagellar basal body P-ring formation protein FlgA
MMRIALSILLLAASAASAAAQGNPRLKPQAIVASDIVRVGDLVENAGLASSTPIFRAPNLGETGTVPARAVVDAVRAAGLIAVDTRGLAEVSVTHASRTIGTEEIEQRIAAVLTQHHNLGKPENLKLTFDRDPRAIELPLTSTAELSAAKISYDRATRRFDVTFELPGAGRAAWRYTGGAIEMVEAAIVMRALSRGDLIRQSDITIERRAKSDFSAEPPAAVGEIIGFAARGAVRPGQPLRRADLMKPEIVKKNDMVLLHYEVPGITLTMRGQALDSGAEGDMVNVLNPNSKRTIQGIVTGPGRVTVSALSPAPAPAQVAAAAPTQ